MNSYAVVFTYNYDNDVAVYLFDNEKEAISYLRGYIEERFRFDVEENRYATSYNISDDGHYGVIKNHFMDRIEVTEVRVGRVYL